MALRLPLQWLALHIERKNNRAENITLAFCWSHLRRRFVEIERTSPAPAAKEVLSRIGQL